MELPDVIKFLNKNSVSGAEHLPISCWPKRSKHPTPPKEYRLLSLLLIAPTPKLDGKTLLLKIPHKILYYRTHRNEGRTDLKTLYPLGSVHGARRCYAGCWGEIH